MSAGGPDAEDPDDTAGFGSWRHRARYRFDNLLARGTWATLLWLGVATLAAVLVSTLVLTAVGVSFTGSDSGWLEDAWQSLLRLIDPGTMAGDVGWGQRTLALAVTIFGILVAGTLIGIIASAVEDRVEQMRRGRSVVIESEHVVVLGASDQLPVLVDLLAGDGRGHGRTVVVLADDDPSDLDARIRAGLSSPGARVVVRAGDPTRREDLALTRLSHASGVVVLDDAGAGDTRAAETVLAVGRTVGGSPSFPVVVEVTDPAIGTRLVDGCGDWVHPLASAEALARSAAFALRAPGQGHVLSELLRPGGCELQVVPAGGWAGRTFDELVLGWVDARPVGIVAADGEVVLHPPGDVAVGHDDRVALLGHGRAGDATAPTRPPPRAGITGTDRGPAWSGPVAAAGPRAPEHLMVVGWSAFAQRLLAEWARWAPTGSLVEVVLDPHEPGPGTGTVDGIDGLTVLREASLARLLEARGGLADVTTVLLFPSDLQAEAEADVRALLDLGVVQRARREAGTADRPRVVMQVRDLDHAPLVLLEGRHDWLTSPGLTSELLAQLVHQPARRDVLLALYDRTSTANLDLVRAGDLGTLGRVGVVDLVATARSRGLLAVGCLWHGPTRDRLVLAPRLDDVVELAADDDVVVVT